MLNSKRFYAPLFATGFLLSTVVSSTVLASSIRLEEKVIYGDDNRRDLYQVTDAAWLRAADSTVALIKRANLKVQPDGSFNIRTENFGKSYNLCAEEPYRDQETGAFCSGFLVTPDTIVTAGHCIRDAYDCNNTSFVFGFGFHQEGAQPKTAAASEAYNCKSVVKSFVQNDGADFAVVKLDRPVENHDPVKLRLSGNVIEGDELTVIGHPAGLPTKVSDGAQVRDASKKGYFVANLDTYGGNSGSAVFNTRTMEVEGILVRGEQDFTYKPGAGCSISYRCADTGCRGEDVTLIGEVFKYLSR